MLLFFFSTEFHFDFYTAISYEFSKQSTRLWSLFLFNLTRKICNYYILIKCSRDYEKIVFIEQRDKAQTF